MVTETSCSLSRAKVRVASRELVSNVECEGTRLTDVGREERVKEERGTGRKEKGGSKGQWSNQVTRGTLLGKIHSGTGRRMVLRCIRGRLLNFFLIFVQSV